MKLHLVRDLDESALEKHCRHNRLKTAQPVHVDEHPDGRHVATGNRQVKWGTSLQAK
jgi:hypothetical protein